MSATVLGDAGPFVYVKPYIRLGDPTTGFEIECAATHVTLGPDQSENTVETFCGVFTSYKAEKWILTITGAMSYGPNGLWQLRSLVNSLIEFAVRPAVASAIGPSNPEAQGTGFLKGFPFIDADPGGATEADIVLGVQGIPTFPEA